MDNLNTIYDIVKVILIQDEAARSSDDYLYHQVCLRINKDILSLPFGHVLTNFNTYNVPCYESVGRARRKVQAQYPELKANKKVQEYRLENEVAYEEFARNEVR